MHLQGAISDQAVQRLFKSGVIHAKPTIGKPRDIYEQEIDGVAYVLIRMPEPQVQQRPEEGEKKDEEEEKIQVKTGDAVAYVE